MPPLPRHKYRRQHQQRYRHQHRHRRHRDRHRRPRSRRAHRPPHRHHQSPPRRRHKRPRARPLPERASSPAKSHPRQQHHHHRLPSPPPPPPRRPAAPAASSETQAAQLLEVAKAKVANNLNDQALGDLRQIVLDFPGSRAAAEAAFMSGEIHEKTGRVDDAMAAYVEFESRFAGDRASRGLEAAPIGAARTTAAGKVTGTLAATAERGGPRLSRLAAVAGGPANQGADRNRQQGPARDRSGDETGRSGDHRDTAHADRAIPGRTAIARGAQSPRPGADARRIATRRPPRCSRTWEQETPVRQAICISASVKSTSAG